jgi:GntR family transcriptional regulator
VTPIPGDSRPRPLQARDAILALVQRGEHEPGSRLPSERQLADRLNVSRPTVREALRILEEEGQIIRRVGIGTFVRKVPQIEAGLESLVSFTEMMARSGHQAGTSHLDVSGGEMSGPEAERFRVEAGTRKLVVKRVRTLDGSPAMYSVHVCPKALIGDPPLAEFRGSFFALLQRHSGMRVSYSDTQISSELAGTEIGERLDLPPRVPLLVLDELVCSADHQVMCTSLSYFRADVHRYRLVRRLCEGNELRRSADYP